MLEVSTTFLKGKRNKKEPSVPATAPCLSPLWAAGYKYKKTNKQKHHASSSIG